MTKYPLSISPEEFKRLNQQFKDINHPIVFEKVKSAQSILDVGCGTGILQTILKPGQNYTGIDIHDYFEKLTDSSEFELKSILDYDPRRKFDLIHLRLMLWCNQDDIEAILKKCFELLSEGGSIVSVEPNDFDLSVSDKSCELYSYVDEWKEVLKTKPFSGNIGKRVLETMKTFDGSVQSEKIIKENKDGRVESTKRTYENLKKIFSDILGVEPKEETIEPLHNLEIKEHYQVSILTR